MKHKPIPPDFPVQPLAKNQEAVSVYNKATCGYCGLSWDDGQPTTWTPSPSGRCPFEHFHIYEENKPKVYHAYEVLTKTSYFCHVDTNAKRMHETLKTVLNQVWQEVYTCTTGTVEANNVEDAVYNVGVNNWKYSQEL